MKTILILMTIPILLASVAWGQSQPQACLVVAGKHHDRIDSLGQVQYRSRYSDKQLRKLSDAGVHVVTLPKRKSDVVLDTATVCGERPIERAMRDAAASIGQKQIARLAGERTCVETLTNRAGEQSCILWSDDERLNRK